MNENDLLKKISELRRITPDANFGAISRNLLTNPNHKLELSEDLKGSLVRLKRISPNTNFALKSKLEILETKRKIRLADIFKKNTTYALATGLATLLIVLMASASSYLKPPVSLLSDADSNELIKEAGNINKDIDIHLQEVNYYAISASKSTVALNEASTSNTDHVNYEVIKNEADRTNYNSGQHNESVDQLLNEASN